MCRKSPLHDECALRYGDEKSHGKEQGTVMMLELGMSLRTPADTVAQLRRLCDLLRESLPTLNGVVLHGSAATAGFEPQRSDLDVLAIVSSNPGEPELAELGDGVLMISGDPSPLEISIVSRGALENWQHPCQHLFHYGEDCRELFESGRIRPQSPTDEDLAMHLVVARARGIDLTGRFPVTQLPEIPRFDYLSAILSDFEWARNRDDDQSSYMVSNACRTLAYLKEGVVLSKSEGKLWCAERDIDCDTVVEDVLCELRSALHHEDRERDKRSKW